MAKKLLPMSSISSINKSLNKTQLASIITESPETESPKNLDVLCIENHA